eukprot:TRINITY_DN67556_c0_g1_i3.p3 TRINITY_DN67556_c0_g1~~TRINITY_DN67556_c0_g1_i3.p3  ORF type:complete len:125 (-),score=15.34 TRINITY_DN67556_c0_g1_i3:61-435(-)
MTLKFSTLGAALAAGILVASSAGVVLAETDSKPKQSQSDTRSGCSHSKSATSQAPRRPVPGICCSGRLFRAPAVLDDCCFGRLGAVVRYCGKAKAGGAFGDPLIAGCALWCAQKSRGKNKQGKK